MKFGFCIEYHNKDYICANCEHRETRQKITNLYEHKTMDWQDEVCPKCGFKSLKPAEISELFKEVSIIKNGTLSDKQGALLRECRAALDDLFIKKPGIESLLCGSTTLGNLRAELNAYKLKD